MPAFVELTEADDWLYGVLSGDATLAALVGSRIYSWETPPNTGSPYVIFHPQSPGVDVRASGRLGTGRVFTTPLYLVRAIAAVTDWATLKPIALRIDQLIEGVNITTVNGNHISVQRESPFQLVQHDGTQQRWRHLGGLYRFYISGP